MNHRHTNPVPEAWASVLQVFKQGAAVHGNYGYQRRPVEYYIAKAKSHAERHVPGVVDPDSGHPHLTHQIANLLIQLQKEIEG